MANVAELMLQLRAQDNASAQISGVHKALQGLGGGLQDVAKLASGVAFGGIAAQLGQSLTQQITGSVGAVKEFAGQVKSLNQLTGGTIEQTSGLVSAFQRFGVGSDQAAVSLSTFSRHLQGIKDPMEELERGIDEHGKPLKGFAETMHDLGVQFKDAAGNARPMNDVLLDVADQFKNMPNGVEKTALATQLFGRSGKDLIPVLNQGRQGLQDAMDTARKFGMVLTTENMAQIKQYSLAQGELNQALNGLKFQLGLALIPAFAALAQTGTQVAIMLNSALSPAIHFLSDLIRPLAQTYVGFLRAEFQFLGDEVMPKLALAWDAVNAVVAAFTDDAGAIGIVYDVIRKVFGDTVADFLQPFLQWFMDAIPGILTFVDDVTSYFAAFGDDLGKLFRGDLPGAVSDFLGHFEEWTVFLANHLAQWGREFLSWLLPLIPPLLEQLSTLLERVGSWMLDPALPTIIEHLTKWGQAFVAWVGPQIPPLLEALAGLLGSVLAWILDPALPAIIEKLAEWAGAFVRWVFDAAAKLPDALMSILDAIGTWVSGTGQKVVEGHGGDLAGSLIQGIVNGIANGAGAIGNALSDAVGKAVQAAIGGFSRGFGGGGGGGGGGATGAYNPTEAAAYIRERAASLGINPDVALAVARSEGLNNPVGDNGSSFGPFQLHMGGLAAGGNAVSGLGDTFKKVTGLDPRDLSNWRQQVDFALQTALQTGWGPWHGAAGAGIGPWTGIGTARGGGGGNIHDVLLGFVGDLSMVRDAESTTEKQTDEDFNLMAASITNHMKESGGNVQTTLQQIQDQFGLSFGAANRILQDHGNVARTVLGTDVPGQFQLTDLAVERFADAFKITWDQARDLLTTGGQVSEVVMGKQIPDAAAAAGTSLSGPGGLLDHTRAMADGLTTVAKPALNEFMQALAKIPDQAKAAAQAYRDMVTAMNNNQVSAGPGGSARQRASELADIGVHEATSASGQSYVISKPYSAMTQAERDDANRFAHQNPSGRIPGFQHGGVVPGPLGFPMLAVVHGGETVTPPGVGLDSDRLAAKIADALASQPINVILNGQAVGNIMRSEFARAARRNGTALAGLT